MDPQRIMKALQAGADAAAEIEEEETLQYFRLAQAYVQSANGNFEKRNALILQGHKVEAAISRMNLTMNTLHDYLQERKDNF